MSPWTHQHLIAGDAWTGGHDWAGLMEGLAIYSRTISAQEAQARYAYRQERAAGRTRAVPLVIEARLTECTPAADPRGIAPYRRCLSVNRYSIVSVISGECRETLIDAAQWSVLDCKVVAAYEKLVKGQVYRLTLENWQDHPEQESERMMTGEFEDISAPLFLDVEIGKEKKSR